MGVLWASEGAIYGRYGYGMAALRATISAPRHQVRLSPPVPDHGRIRLLEVDEAQRRPAAPSGSGLLRSHPASSAAAPPGGRREVLDDAPSGAWWRGPRFIPAVEVDGRIEGYAFYRMRTEWDHLGPRNMLEVRELVAPDPAAELALWRFLFEMDLVATVKAFNVPVDTPLFLRVDDPRRLGMTVGDGLWLRILDLPGRARRAGLGGRRRRRAGRRR